MYPFAYATIPSGSQPGLSAQGMGNDELDEAVEIAGYLYDSTQDIFYSSMDPWQRHIGYCRLYDDAMAIMGMIVDCEPVWFEYGGKKWLIELWKGQYDLVTGCEIGVYTAEFDLGIPGVFGGTFYSSVSNANLLQMSCSLKKNGSTLFRREEKHWWLTGFKLGEFSQPSELKMDVGITLHNEEMREAFVTGLKAAGYADDVFTVKANTVSFTFDVPHARQPATRTPETDRIIQGKNRLLCEMYQEITGPYPTTKEKLKAIEEQAPELYHKILNLGKTKKLFQVLALALMSGTLLIALFKGVNRASARSELL